MGMENYNPPQEPWLVILYQDEHIMVVNKPSGLLSVPGRLEAHKDSIMTRIQRDYPQAESVHRLDMATSGVIVVALTKAAERELKNVSRKSSMWRAYGGIPPRRKDWSTYRSSATGRTGQSRKCVMKPANRRKRNITWWSLRRIIPPAWC